MPNATSPRRLLSVALLAILALGAAPPPRRPGTRPAPTTPPFEESIEVVDTSVVVVPPARLRRADERDWEVHENGAVRKVDRVEMLGDEPWQILIWIDGPLCAQASQARTLLALAHQAEALTRRGSVRIVAAAPEPKVVLAATREPGAVVSALAALSSQALCTGEPDGLFWQARGMPRGAPMNAALATRDGAAAALGELRTLVERRASLLADATPACESDACVVFLVSHGYPLDADLRLPAELRPASSHELASALAAATDGLARRLVSTRWLLVALPFAPPPPADEPAEADQSIPKGARPGPEPFPDMGDQAPPAAPAPVRRLPAIAPPPAATDVYLLPELAPLRRLASLTAGAVLRVPEQLPPLFASFADRRRIWYRTSPLQPGETRELQVFVRGRQAEAPAWIGRPRQ
ncbi:MAG TPA: hypothetical protein VGS57_18490 [Thermoanaerobaculia bacterium]|jgi:hypothetical protein|nr:hypothetical protein [Thermoanaerobaculia bacterium]